MLKNIIRIIIIFVFLYGCGAKNSPTTTPLSEFSTPELIQILESFKENDSSIYPRYQIVNEIKMRGSSAAAAAPALARSMAYNDRGSYQASEALVAIGPSAYTAIPFLLINLDNPREEVRRHSIFVLGFLRESSSCAVPKIALMLWDSEPYVRSISASALTEITGENLVEFEDYKLDPTLPGSANPDEPEGSITGIARNWWLDIGQNQEWDTTNCEISEP
jgi:HEAT repeat protein